MDIDRGDTPHEATRLQQAAEEAGWLVDRGYPAGAASRFVGEHRQLAADELALLACNARLHACVRHHIARELDPEDIRKRVLRVDAASVLSVVSAALAGKTLLKSAAGVLCDPSWERDSWPTDLARPLDRVARVLSELRPAETRWLAPAHTQAALEGALASLGKQPWRASVEPCDDVGAKSNNAPFVVSADPAVLDRCATWVNIVSLALEGVDAPRLEL